MTVRMRKFQGNWIPDEHCASNKVSSGRSAVKWERWGGNILSSCFMWCNYILLALFIFSTKVFKMCALFLGHSVLCRWNSGFRSKVCLEICNIRILILNLALILEFNAGSCVWSCITNNWLWAELPEMSWIFFHNSAYCILRFFSQDTHLSYSLLWRNFHRFLHILFRRF
jgi:hypothetical protein